MTRTQKIIYWVATIWLALAMLASGLQQVFLMKSFVDIVVPLGYPLYFLCIIGIWKILGVIAILVPGFGLVKEWAYAGFFFTMSGAVASHLACHATFGQLIPALTLLIMTVASWYFRPANRRLTAVTNT